MKQELKIEIEVPDGYKAVYDKDTQKVELIDATLPKTWEEFCKNNPVDFKESFIYEGKVDNVFIEGKRDPKNKDLFPNRETAEAFLALMQLIQLRDCYRQGWTPDWKQPYKKHCIYRNGDSISPCDAIFVSQVLSFQIEEIRDEFLKNFRDLIEQAKELI